MRKEIFRCDFCGRGIDDDKVILFKIENYSLDGCFSCTSKIIVVITNTDKTFQEIRDRILTKVTTPTGPIKRHFENS